MQITKMFYPLAGTEKFQVIHNGKEYTCYISPFMRNQVFTGNALMEGCKDITDTKLGMEIMLECGKLYK